MTRVFSASRGWLWIALLAWVPILVNAQVAPDWSAGIPGNTGVMVALDASNNAYVAGSAAGPTITLTKYSPAGTQLWQRSRSDLPGRSTHVNVDAAGNPTLTGYLTDAQGGIAVSSVVFKYDPTGTLLWQDIVTAASGYGQSTLTDAAGNTYLLGRYVQPGGPATGEVTVIKYDGAGTRLWTRTFGAFFTVDEAMIMTSTGKLVVAGTNYFEGLIVAFDDAGNRVWTQSIPINAGYDFRLAAGRSGDFYVIGGPGGGFRVAKFDAAFNQVWRNNYPAAGTARKAAVDSAGDVIVTGPVNTNTGPLTVVIYDWLTMKLSPAGTPLWSRQYGQPVFINDIPNGIGVGPGDAIYITGEGSMAGIPSTITVKYGADGTQLWEANTSAAYRGLALQVGTDGGVFVVGETPQTLLRYPQSGLANVAPTAVGTATPNSGIAPLSVNFSSAGSADADGAIASYLWNFGDGQRSVLANPSHVYAAGNYSATLTVTDTLGAASTSAPIAITATTGPVPTALTLASSSVRGGKSTTATVTVSGASGVTVTLSSSNTTVARVPATVQIPAGSNRASFTVQTSKVRQDTVVAIRATAHGGTASTSLTVRR